MCTSRDGSVLFIFHGATSKVFKVGTGFRHTLAGTVHDTSPRLDTQRIISVVASHDTSPVTGEDFMAHMRQAAEEGKEDEAGGPNGEPQVPRNRPSHG